MLFRSGEAIANELRRDSKFRLVVVLPDDEAYVPPPTIRLSPAAFALSLTSAAFAGALVVVGALVVRRCWGARASVAVLKEEMSGDTELVPRRRRKAGAALGLNRAARRAHVDME